MPEFLGPIIAPQDYTPELEMRPAALKVAYINLVVSQPVFFELYVPIEGMPAGKYAPEGRERYIQATQVAGVQIFNASGFRIRSATAALAEVQAELVYENDPQLSLPSGVRAETTGAGVLIRSNGVDVGTEPALDFFDGANTGDIVFNVLDDPGNEVSVSARAVNVPRLVRNEFSIDNDGAFNEVFAPIFALEPGGQFRFGVQARYKNATGNPHTFSVKIGYDTVDLWEATSGVIGSSALLRAWRLEGVLTREDADDTVTRLAGYLSVSTANVPTTGQGDLQTADIVAGTFSGKGTYTPADLTFRLAIELGTTDPDLEIAGTCRGEIWTPG